MNLGKKLAAEFIGTFWLVFGGCGSAVIAAAFPKVGIGLLGVAFAFGLTLLTMAYAIGHISGCHLNPAVSVGLWAGKRFPASDLLPYIVAQVAGAVLAASVLYLIASGKPGFDLSGGFAANGYGEHSPGGYSFACRLRCRSCADVYVPDNYHGGDAREGTKRFRTNSDRIGSHSHSSNRDPRDQCFGQPSPQHRPSPFCWRMGTHSAMALLASSSNRWDPGRGRVSDPGTRSCCRTCSDRRLIVVPGL